jgi:hypothetical protein
MACYLLSPVFDFGDMLLTRRMSADLPTPSSPTTTTFTLSGMPDWHIEWDAIREFKSLENIQEVRNSN